MEFVFETQNIIGGQNQVELVAAFIEAGDIGMAGKTKFFVIAKGATMFGKVMIVHIFETGICVLTDNGLVNPKSSCLQGFVGTRHAVSLPKKFPIPP
ncbi:hypothetical protein KKHLCK_14265 [Candidatus Electrothrix laxa]